MFKALGFLRTWANSKATSHGFRTQCQAFFVMSTVTLLLQSNMFRCDVLMPSRNSKKLRRNKEQINLNDTGWLPFLPCTFHWWSSWSSTWQSSSAPQMPSGSWSWSCQPRRHGPSLKTEQRLGPPPGESWEYWYLAWEWGIYQRDGRGHPQMVLWGLRGGRNNWRGCFGIINDNDNWDY